MPNTRTNHDDSVVTNCGSRDENIAAISAQFHSNKKDYDKFYEANADELSGFPGIWRYCIDAAIQFTRAEDVFGDQFEYIEAIDNFVLALFRDGTVLTKLELRKVAVKAITDASY